MEERGGFRRPTIKSASSLSISGEAGLPISGDSLSGGGRSGSGDTRFEGEYQSMSSALCASAPSHPLHAMPPRFTRNSDRPRASDRTMVDTEDTRTRLPRFQTRLASSPSADELHRDGKQPRAKPLEPIGGHTYSSGLDLETKIFSSSGRGRGFFLTSLFIELVDGSMHYEK